MIQPITDSQREAERLWAQQVYARIPVEERLLMAALHLHSAEQGRGIPHWVCVALGVGVPTDLRHKWLNKACRDFLKEEASFW